MAERSTYMGWKLDYTQPPGEPAYIGPDSVTWRIYKNPISRVIGGVCAVLLEFADPRIRSGVWDHSTYRRDPVGRSERTGHAAMIGAYGPASAARKIIGGVNRMHARVEGVTPDGQHYKALDQELLDWVAATAGYGFLVAYHRFVSPLSDQEIRQFFSESTEIAKLYGVKTKPASLEDFHQMMAKLGPGFEAHPINEEFLQVLQNSAKERKIPGFLLHAIVCAAVDIVPKSVSERLGLNDKYKLSRSGRLLVKLVARLSERIPKPDSPAGQSCERLGLPRTFLWMSKRKQAALLEELQASGRLKNWESYSNDAS